MDCFIVARPRPRTKSEVIGVKKRMIVVAMGFMPVVMINPEILSKSGEYEAEEGCLSLTGTRKTTRYRYIEVKYQDPTFKWQRQKFSGPIAQAIQHDMRDGNLRFPWSSLCVA